jgi:hypothetical protein
VGLNKTVKLSGGWNTTFTTRAPGTYPTVLDAHNQGRVIYIFGNVSPTIEGFIITGGNASYVIEAGRGGGIYISDASPVIAGCIITNNIGYMGMDIVAYGGGIYTKNASLVLMDSKVISNTASVFTGCSGGGISIWNFSSFSMLRTVVQDNRSSEGGGIHAVNSSRLSISNSHILNNTAQMGGGVHVSFDASLGMTNTIVAQNAGGGVHLLSSSGRVFKLTNNTLVSNMGEGGEGILAAGNPEIYLINNIVVSHTVGLRSESILIYTPTIHSTYNNIWGNSSNYDGVTPGTGDISADPLFHNPIMGDYHLKHGSPCIDAGDPAGVPPAPPNDIDSDPRPIGLRVDIGADEYALHVYLPLIMKIYAP